MWQLAQAWKAAGISRIIDIGANSGQFALAARAYGFQGEIFSVEPLRDVYEELLIKAAADPLWTVLPQVAIGAENGEAVINVSGNSVSSSLLPMLEAHAAAAASSRYVRQEFVVVRTLDSLLEETGVSAKNALIKIDSQGYERQVCVGGQNTLSQAAGVLLELSMVPLYEGQTLWIEMLRFLEDQGFQVWSFERAFSDMRDGRTLQLDALLLRAGSSKATCEP